ncbi:MAG: hypothetical protein A3F90_07885 [Deltaproteobacteria bacterium RIFCSPLOWO2_12_FULL_60_19]|nr:MAG: hypothetical protein A3F90_07885 [Deltaproteobacteria bacterium RIFCSPLOWO2_12_FULL_60_19]
MLERILEFSRMLRQNGVRVSVSENMDAVRALELLGIADRTLFKSALRASLVKRSIDVEPFNRLFDLYFLGQGQSPRATEQELMAELGLTPEQFEKMLEQIREFLRRMDGEVSPLTRALLAGELAQVERMMFEAAEGELGEMTQWARGTGFIDQIAARFMLASIREEIEKFKMALARAGAEPRIPWISEKISEYAEQRLRELMRLAQRLLQREMQKKEAAVPGRRRSDDLSQKSFAYYTEEDIRRMSEVVTRLARRFKNLLSLRRRRARRGRLAVSATFRKNLQYGGVPFRIQLERRRKEKPQVVVLCDISDSVLNASRFMLQFVYSIQDLYTKVRSFVFVSDIGEVTRLFEEHELRQAVEMALRGDVIDVYSHSNFGRAFELFHRNYISAVTGKTTFVIIGDGRNNYNRANEWVVREIRQKAKQLIWLNPESRLTWGYGDSEMPRYAQYCDLVEECRNIEQLYKVIDRIAA